MKDNLIDFFKKTYNKALSHKVISSIIIISIAYLFYHYILNKTVSTTTYQYTTVKRGTLIDTVSGTGQVVSNSQVDLKPKVNASVTNVYVKAGDRVRVGQVLFRLDATDAYKQVRDAKVSLESAQIALEKLTNPKDIDVMTINNSLKQEEDNKKSEDQKVDTAYRNLLNANLQVVVDGSYTTETAPALTGSYTGNKEGQIKISVNQGGITGYSFSVSGIASGYGSVNTIVAQPLGDTGLYIKWNTIPPLSNWIIDIPNKQSTSYSSNYNAWQNAITNREINNAASDRNIVSLKQKLADLKPSDDNLDVRSAKLTVQQRQNTLDDAQYNLSNYTITAPFNGVMANVSVDIGSSAVMASANSSSALGTIVTDKKLAQVTLNETDIPKIKLGQKAKITFDAIEGLELNGDIVEINTLGTVTSGVVTYKVKVAFATDDARILPNMSVSVDIITDSKENVLYVSNQAVKHDAQGYYVEQNSSMAGESLASSTRAFDNASSTFNKTLSTASSTRRNGNGTSSYQRNGGVVATSSADVILRRVSVEIGMQNGTQTEIVSGLKEGESVVSKKTTTSTAGTVAPSVTSLFRPQQSAGGRTTGGNFKPQ